MYTKVNTIMDSRKKKAGVTTFVKNTLYGGKDISSIYNPHNYIP